MEENITLEEATELLFNRESIYAAIHAEDEADCLLSAGLDWGNTWVFASFLENPALLHRITILRLSLNQEIRQMLQEWNLGIAEEKAIETACTRLFSRLQLPQQNAIPALKDVLMRDDLYSEELITDRPLLQQLLHLLCDEQDWDTIATVAATAVRERILVKVGTPRF
jgi:hypothetical protein